jgi:hypothetical protein
VVCGAKQLEDALCGVMQVEHTNMVSKAVEDALYEVIPIKPCIIQVEDALRRVTQVEDS